MKLNNQFETVACPVCAHSEFTPYLQVPDRFDLEGGHRFNIVRCTRCKHAFLNPRPGRNKISKYYQHEAYQPFLSTQEKKGGLDYVYDLSRRFSIEWKRKMIEQMVSVGKILDLGCGTGEFLHHMQTHGWEVAGIETDSKAVEFARNHYHLRVFHSEIEQIDLKEELFQVITFWHVLEHVYEPVEILKKLREHLQQDGLMVIAAPNYTSLDATFYGSYWIAWDAPRHLHHFTPPVMETIARLAGLSLVGIKPMILDAFYNCLMSELLKIHHKRYLKFGVPLLAMRAVCIAMISLAYATRLFSGSKKASAIIYFLKRKGSS